MSWEMLVDVTDVIANLCIIFAVVTVFGGLGALALKDWRRGRHGK